MSDKIPDKNPKAILIMGPTAAGKTALAFELADKLPCEVISVDSALVYRGMDIGTAKPTSTELERVPHHLVNIRDADEVYSAASFVSDVKLAIDMALAKQRIPLLVGGTMLYFKALIHGLNELPAADPAVRKRLEELAKNQGLLFLHDRLKQIDAPSARRIHPNDPQRLLRALEVFEVSGKTMTELTQAQQKPILPIDPVSFAIAPVERAVIHQRIEQRFVQMLQSGFEAEVYDFWQSPRFSIDLPSMKSVGYRQMWQYLDGELSHGEMKDRSIIATRQLAKRQLTWLRSWPDVTWMDSTAPDFLKKALKTIKQSLI